MGRRTLETENRIIEVEPLLALIRLEVAGDGRPFIASDLTVEEAWLLVKYLTQAADAVAGRLSGKATARECTAVEAAVATTNDAVAALAAAEREVLEAWRARCPLQMALRVADARWATAGAAVARARAAYEAAQQAEWLEVAADETGG